MTAIAIRADVSVRLGTGHITRCLVLADAFRRRGRRVTVISRDAGDGLCAHFEARARASGLDWITLPRLDAPAAESGIEDSRLLGMDWQEDAAQTATAIPPDCGWLVVDHYGIDARWQALHRHHRRIAVITDLAGRNYACDLLLDQNIVPGGATRHAGFVDGAAAQLLGPAWALLNPDYQRWHDRVPPRRGRIRRMLAFFGGVDADDFSGRLVDAFRRVTVADVQLDLVIGAGYQRGVELRARASDDTRVNIHSAMPSLAPLVAAADLGIGAAGSASWERLCLGLPSLIVTVAPNQVPLAAGMEAAGVARLLGHGDAVTVDSLAEALASACAAGADTEMSMRAREAVDGRGAERVMVCVDWLESRPTARMSAALHGRELAIADLAAVEQMPSLPESGPSDPAWTDALRDVATSWPVALCLDDVTVGAVGLRRDRGTLSVSGIVSAIGIPEGFRVDALAVALGVVRRRLTEPLRLAGSGRGLRLALCADRDSWIHDVVARLAAAWWLEGHDVTWHHDATAVPPGDLRFLLSYSRIIPPEVLTQFRHNLVVHASPLPRGRGMSPMTWLVLEGATSLPVHLIEAEAALDTGCIYASEQIELSGNELVDELRAQLAESTYRLCRTFVEEWPDSSSRGRQQRGEPTYYRRRRPADSAMDIAAPLASQFDLLRVADPDAYPAWFDHRGRRFAIRLAPIVPPAATAAAPTGPKS